MFKMKPIIFQNSIKILLKLFFVSSSFFIWLFPLISYKINIESAIFPAFEIIFIYYVTSLYSLNIVIIFLISFIMDQAYSMPIGMNSLVFLFAFMVLKLIARFFPIKHYVANFIIFCFYCFLIISLRYILIMKVKKLQVDSYLVILFQYLTTIFSYNLIRVFLDSSIDLFQRNVKLKNPI